MRQINSIRELHEFLQIEPNPHPLISVNDLSLYNDSYIDAGRQTYQTQFFLIHLIQAPLDGIIRLGNIKLESKPNQLTFSPVGRTRNFEPNNMKTVRKGWGLYIHPEFLIKHPLGRKIYSFPYFAHNFFEAISLKSSELETTEQLFNMIKIEVDKPESNINNNLVYKLLDVFFEYINSFSEHLNFRTIENELYYQFNQRVIEYLYSERPLMDGFPTVKMFATELNVTENHLRSKVKLFSSQPPSKLIQDCVITLSKHELITSNNSIQEISMKLGFNNQSSFTKYFKNVLEISPIQYRNEFK